MKKGTKEKPRNKGLTLELLIEFFKNIKNQRNKEV